jgi:hypothetical protein
LIGGGVCLDTEGVSGVVKLKNCERTARNQQWDYDVKVRNRKSYFNSVKFLTKFFFSNIKNRIINLEIDKLRLV